MMDYCSELLSVIMSWFKEENPVRHLLTKEFTAHTNKHLQTVYLWEKEQVEDF